MKRKIATIEEYFAEGCGRCEHMATPHCKVNIWRQELRALQRIVVSCGLEETLKWSQPCYTHEGQNVLLIAAFRGYCCISFFQGALLQDDAGWLEAAGPNSQAGRLLRFRSLEEIAAAEGAIVGFIQQAIALRASGAKVNFRSADAWDLVPELQAALDADPALHAAFSALTPGRRRGYHLHISGAKQAKTRVARVEKCIPLILEGIGLHDRQRPR